jgi:hypothetical protein
LYLGEEIICRHPSLYLEEESNRRTWHIQYNVETRGTAYEDIAGQCSKYQCYIHPVLLQTVREASKKGGVQMVVDEVGMSEVFFDTYASRGTKANVLSFAAVEDLYKISYIQCEALAVHMLDRDLVFR